MLDGSAASPISQRGPLVQLGLTVSIAVLVDARCKRLYSSMALFGLYAEEKVLQRRLSPSFVAVPQG